jgi:hypothetical protein
MEEAEDMDMDTSIQSVTGASPDMDMSSGRGTAATVVPTSAGIVMGASVATTLAPMVAPTVAPTVGLTSKREGSPAAGSDGGMDMEMDPSCSVLSDVRIRRGAAEAHPRMATVAMQVVFIVLCVDVRC